MRPADPNLARDFDRNKIEEAVVELGEEFPEIAHAIEHRLYILDCATQGLYGLCLEAAIILDALRRR